jgi:cytochrome P450
MSVTIDDELYSAEVLADPYTYYGRIREEDPVHWNARYQTWLVTRYDDIVWVLRHPEVFSSRFFADDPQLPSPPIDEADVDEFRYVVEFRSHELIQNDPPDHTRMRAVVNKFFTPSRLEQWRGMVRGVVHELLDEAIEAGGADGIDVCADLGRPLPLRVISELLGVPREDRAPLKEHADRRMLSSLGLDPDRMRVAASGIRDTSAYLEKELGNHRADGHDILSILIDAEERTVYSREEVLANAQGLIDAGHETTIQLICNGTLAFLRNPDQWETFKAAPAQLAMTAVNECLRYDPPLPAPRRLTARDVELGGKTIRRGERVTYVLAAANRDPRAFEDPDRFDIARTPNRHLAFGSGIHFCLGQYLAKLEGEEVFKALAERMPDMRLVSDHVDYARIRGVRAVLSLPVSGRLSPAAGG